MGASPLIIANTQWDQGAYTSRNRGNLIVPHGSVTSNTGNDRWTTLRKEFTTSGYIVPASKTLYLTKLFYWSTKAGGTFQILYGDTDVGRNAAAAPTNPVYYEGTSPGVAAAWVTPVTYTPYTVDLHATIPADKYLAIMGIDGASTYLATFLGHEE